MPSGHSSSSHSSSGHSSSSHSSGFSSGHSSSHYSSSHSSGGASGHSSGGPSRHSSGSSASRHSQTSHSSYSASARKTWTAGSRTYVPVYRSRRNQPRFYQGPDPKRYACHHHDYVYYPVSWESEGTSYAAGYYDEDGNHYDSVLIKDEQTICKCEYCGSTVKIKWEGGALPNCPNCGAPLSVQATDEAGRPEGQPVKEETGSASSGTAGKKKSSLAGIIIGIVVILFFIKFAWTFVSVWKEEESVGMQTQEVTAPETDSQETSGTEYAEQGDYADMELPEELYVDAIGRSCPLGSDGNYYDSQTGTYFWFNTDVSPAQWQYWVEGISDDYGDYGWMEYDDGEGTWYIETEDGWEQLPDSYDADALWHFEDAYTFPE